MALAARCPSACARHERGRRHQHENQQRKDAACRVGHGPDAVGVSGFQGPFLGAFPLSRLRDGAYVVADAAPFGLRRLPPVRWIASQSQRFRPGRRIPSHHRHARKGAGSLPGGAGAIRRDQADCYRRRPPPRAGPAGRAQRDVLRAPARQGTEDGRQDPASLGRPAQCRPDRRLDRVEPGESRPI